MLNSEVKISKEGLVFHNFFAKKADQKVFYGNFARFQRRYLLFCLSVCQDFTTALDCWLQVPSVIEKEMANLGVVKEMY